MVLMINLDNHTRPKYRATNNFCYQVKHGGLGDPSKQQPKNKTKQPSTAQDEALTSTTSKNSYFSFSYSPSHADTLSPPNAAGSFI